MSHEKRSRGKEGCDDRLFGEKVQATLKEALIDYGYLLTRGFAQKSSVQLVGNRYRLNVRQQKALMNMGASDEQVALRAKRACAPEFLKGQSVAIDGFNLLIVLETAFSGGYVFRGRDGYYRDVSGIHGSYKRVSQTEEVILTIGRYLEDRQSTSVTWVLDQPVSNSGRLKTLLRSLAEENQWNWEVLLDHNPDQYLVGLPDIIVSSDAWVLDRADRNFNLAANLIDSLKEQSAVVKL